MVVYAPPESDYDQVAREIADDRDVDVSQSLAEAVDAGGRVTYVCDPEEVTDGALFELQRRLQERGPDDGGFSVVTGYTPTHARDLYFDSPESRETDLLAFQHTDESFESTGEERLETGSDLELADVEALSERGLRSFAVLSSGWSIHLRLGDGFLCGFPESESVGDYDGRQPYCVSDGDRECPLDGDLVAAESLDASHVFVASCASVVDNNVTGLPVHVGTGLLAGAESLIGSYRVAPAGEFELLLNHSLLKAGYDVTERCRLLNENAHAIGFKAYPYVPFGDSRAAVDADTGEFSAAAESTGGGVTVTFTDVAAPVVDYRLPLTETPFARDDRELYARLRGDREVGSHVYYSAFVDGDAVRLLVYSTGWLEHDRLEFTIAGDVARSGDRRLAREYLDALERHEALGLLSSRAERQLHNLRSQVYSHGEYLMAERFDPTAYRASEQRVDDLVDDVDAVERELVSVVDQWEMLYKKYQSKAVDADAWPTDERCHVCDRRLFARGVRDVRGRVYRTSGLCPRCGFVFDVPGAAELTYPRVHGDLVNQSADRVAVPVSFENPRSTQARARFVPLVYHLDDGERRRYFSPRETQVTLEPSQRHRVEFTLDTTELDPNTYYVGVYVLLNGEIYVGNNLLVVGEKSSRRPLT